MVTMRCLDRAERGVSPQCRDPGAVCSCDSVIRWSGGRGDVKVKAEERFVAASSRCESSEMENYCAENCKNNVLNPTQRGACPHKRGKGLLKPVSVNVSVSFSDR